VHIRTNNDLQNAPILAINRKLGYKAEPGVVQVCERAGLELGDYLLMAGNENEFDY
jgi:hypothetical protein